MSGGDKLYILGAGNVGLGLALALERAKQPPLGVAARSPTSRRRARRLLHTTVEGPDGGPAMDDATLVLLCVRDADIPPLAARLHERLGSKRHVRIAHVSGALPSDVLAPWPAERRASLHPLVSCPEPRRAAERLKSGTYAVEGAAALVRRLRTLVRALGGRTVTIDAEEKARYHAAAALAANLGVVLVELAAREASAAGLAHADAELARLLRGALDNVESMGMAAALTGPLVRGDVETVARHLEVLQEPARSVYRTLSRAALEVLPRDKRAPSQHARWVRLLDGATKL